MAFFLPVIMSVVDRLRFPSSARMDEDNNNNNNSSNSNSNNKDDEDEEEIAMAGRASRRGERKRCCGAGWWSRAAGSVLRLGAVPRHVALVLDGNRRFAARAGLAQRSAGHALGFDALHDALRWCFDARVRAVTVFAFSIDNFRRPAHEVATLMALALDKFQFLLEHSRLMKRYQVVIRVWGDLSLLSPALQTLVLRVMAETRGNVGPALNVCFPYTSSHEVVTAAKQLKGHCPDALALGNALFSHGDHPDLLIRTSGEARLSDFLCWQTGRSHFLVYKCLWPEFTLWHFVAAVLIFRFQMKLK
jgi:ditrans,polycis-polyprenyl diphosphate synthase